MAKLKILFKVPALNFEERYSGVLDSLSCWGELDRKQAILTYDEHDQNVCDNILRILTANHDMIIGKPI